MTIAFIAETSSLRVVDLPCEVAARTVLVAVRNLAPHPSGEAHAAAGFVGEKL
jgi:hypothetical protein